MYTLFFYVPASHLASVKEAIFNAGAGKIGNYDCCAWQTMGLGQFRPLQGSNPSIGQIHQVEEIDEYRVETMCRDQDLENILRALLKAHPYETPAYAYWRVNVAAN